MFALFASLSLTATLLIAAYTIFELTADALVLRGRAYFRAIFIAIVVWALGLLGTMLATDPTIVDAFYRLNSIAILAGCACFTIWTVTYTDPHAKLTDWKCAVPIGLTLLHTLVMLTHPWHNIAYNALDSTSMFPGPTSLTPYTLLLIPSTTAVIIVGAVALNRAGLFHSMLHLLPYRMALVLIGVAVVGYGGMLLVPHPVVKEILCIAYIGAMPFLTLVGRGYMRRLASLPVSVWQVVNDLRDGLITLSPSGVIVNINETAAELLGPHQQPDLIGMPLAQLSPQLAALLAAEHVDEQTHLSVNLGAGANRDVRVVPFMQAAAQQASYHLTLYDNTDRLRAEEQAILLAKQAEQTRILEQLVTALSHDFRTPLSVISLKVHMIQRLAEQTGNDKIGTYSDSVVDHVGRMTAMLEHILKFVKVQHSNPDAKTRVGLRPLLKDLVTSHQYSRPHIAYEWSTTADKTCAVWADAQQLQLAVNSILDNAVTYVPATQGVIRVSLHQERAAAVICVEDNGPGIAPEHQERVFEPFYRADAARTHSDAKAIHSGLGLAMVRQIMDNHAGAAHIESEPQRYTRVILRLPLLEQPQQHSPDAALEPTQAPPSDPPQAPAA